MKLWYPNRAQWRVIAGVYVVALVVSVQWTSPRLEPLTQEVLDRRKAMFGTTDREMIILHLEEELLKPATTPHEEATQEVLRNTKEGFERERELSQLEHFDPSMPNSRFVTFLVIGGALAVWRLQGRHVPTKEA